MDDPTADEAAAFLSGPGVTTSPNVLAHLRVLIAAYRANKATVTKLNEFNASTSRVYQEALEGYEENKQALRANEAENLTLRNAGVNLLSRAEAAESAAEKCRLALAFYAKPEHYEPGPVAGGINCVHGLIHDRDRGEQARNILAGLSRP